MIHDTGGREGGREGTLITGFFPITIPAKLKVLTHDY
jgi:hypothetical protein